jgi:hypothetical protein
MRLLSLFSGGGGLDMAAELLWPDLQHVAFSELDPHAAAVTQPEPDIHDLLCHPTQHARNAPMVPAASGCWRRPFRGGGRQCRREPFRLGQCREHYEEMRQW